jgi:4-oxalocrotonate tautomerase
MPRGGGGGGVELSISYSQEGAMPLINVRIIENVFTAEQKQQITHDLTEAMVAIEGERMRGVTWCVVEEVKSGDWAIGGQPLTTEAVQALARGDVSLPV